MKILTATASLFLFYLSSTTEAAPNGASACPGGMPAVGGPHLREGFVNSTLAGGGIVTSFGNENQGFILESGNTFNTTPSETWFLVLEAFEAPIRGVLVRLECQTDLTGVMSSESPLLQDAAVCDQDDGFVVGMTHTSNVDKEVIDIAFALDTVTTVSVDITVVMANNDEDGSIFYYDRFYYSAKHPACNICGDLGEVQNPTGVIPIPEGTLPGIGLTEIDCATAAAFGFDGQIAPEICPLVPTLAAGICQCGQVVVDPTMDPSESTTPPETSTPPETTTPSEGTPMPTEGPTAAGKAVAKLSTVVIFATVAFVMFAL
ncbi:MAG: hypothetical protein SGILL_007412 [Bacillariaceae sp.]